MVKIEKITAINFTLEDVEDLKGGIGANYDNAESTRFIKENNEEIQEQDNT